LDLAHGTPPHARVGRVVAERTTLRKHLPVGTNTSRGERFETLSRGPLVTVALTGGDSLTGEIGVDRSARHFAGPWMMKKARERDRHSAPPTPSKVPAPSGVARLAARAVSPCAGVFVVDARLGRE